METITVYTIEELKEKFPEGFEFAHNKFAEQELTDIPWQNEIIESLKELFKYAGINLKDWSLGLEHSWIKFDMDEEIKDYTGKKAMIWLKNTFDLTSAKLVHYKNHLGKKAMRYDFYIKDGKPWDLPFTGYCADYDYLESLFLDVHTGSTLGDSFSYLANMCQHLLESELEYSQSEENFVEMANCNDWKFLEDGRMI